MIRWLASACVCALLLNGSAVAADVGGSATQAEAPDQTAILAKIQEAASAVDRNDFKAASDSARAAIDAPAFVNLPAAGQRAAFLVLGLSLINLKQSAQAHEVLVRATALDGAAWQDWQLRLASADDHDRAEILTCLATLAERWPDQLGDYRDYVRQILFETRLDTAVRDLRVRTLEALMAASWPKDGMPGEFDVFRIDLIKTYLERGDTDRAIAVARAVTSPYDLIRLSIDKRNDALRPALGDHLRIDAADHANIDALTAYVATHSDRLKAVANLTLDLIHDGQAAKALTLIDQALAKAKAVAEAKPAFIDYDSQINWIYNNRSSALLVLGRTEEGLAAMAEGAAKSENGGVNVSQTINLGDSYNAFARPRDALAAVAAVSERNVSPYGLMQAEEVRACAYAQMGDTARYQTKLAFVRAHMKDAPASLQRVLLCANDLDGAAKVVVQRLRDPALRGDALMDLQSFAHPDTEPPFQAETRRHLERVRDRPEVRAAIDAVGRIETVPVYPEDY